MKKIFLLLVFFPLIMLVSCLEKEKKIYIYAETVIKYKLEETPIDTITYSYRLSAYNDKDAFLQAYKKYYTNMRYLLRIKTYLSDDKCFYTSNRFKVFNSEGKPVRLDYSDVREEMTMIEEITIKRTY